MANRNYASGGKIYSMHVKPVLLDCNFVVDSTNSNGLGISSLKGPMIQNVFMNVQAGPANTLPLLSARSYSILSSSAVTNTGSSVITGNIGIYPGSAVTGFPPGTFSGSENIANAASQLAQSQALAAYNQGIALTFTPISANLNGQTLTPGNYSESSGTFNLAAAGAGTLTLNGAGVYIFKASSTLTTGAGGIPTITLSGGALASNVYWLVGSSATINSGFSGTFQGNIIAVTSITDTLGGTVNGSMIALGGAVTLSAAANVNAQALVPSSLGAGNSNPASPNVVVTNPNPAPGSIVVQFQDNFNRSFSGFHQIRSPSSGSALKIDNSALTQGVPYIISTVGSSTAAQWRALGLPAGVSPAIGASFIASSVGAGANSSSSRVMAASAVGSGVMSIEVVGDPNISIAPDLAQSQGFGAQIILQARSGSGALIAPADGSVISLAFYLSDSSVQVMGE